LKIFINLVNNYLKIATASFIAYILIDEKNDLDASKAFVSITLFNIMRFPMMMFPQVITSLIRNKNLKKKKDNKKFDIKLNYS
jgi:ATP-binding cassette, subfamily C (CFTR/MRP), member 1